MMADGKQVPISKVAPGDSIRVLDQERRQSFSTKVVEIQQTPITESYVIGLDKGHEIKASPLQKIATSAGPVDVAKLRIGSKVVAGDQLAGEVMSIRRVVGDIVLFSLKLEAAGDYLVGHGAALAAAKQKG